MNKRLLFWLGIFILVLLIIAGVLSAVAAANNVALSRATDQTKPISANDLKPSQCAAFNLIGIFVCSKNNCKAPGPNLLVIGIPTTMKIDGGGGNSCCVGNPAITYSNCAWHP